MILRRFLQSVVLLLTLITADSARLSAQSFFYSGIPDIPNYTASEVFPHPDGYILSLLYDSAGIPLNTFMLFDNNGSIQWRKKLQGAGGSTIKPGSFYFDDDGSYWISGEEVLSDTVQDAFVCKFNANDILVWGKKIISGKEINLSGPLLKDTTDILAAVNTQQKIFNAYFGDAFVSVLDATSGQLTRTLGFISNSLAREFKLTHAMKARNDDFLGLFSYRVNAGNPGAGFALVRMSQDGEIRFSYSINLNQNYRFGSTRGIAETESGKIIVACQLDSADTNSTIKPGFLAMFADSGTILQQRILGFTPDFDLSIEQLSATASEVPSLFCTIEEDGNRFWATAQIDTSDLTLFASRRLPVSTDLIPALTDKNPRQSVISDNLGGVFATAGLYCDSESKSFTAMLHWSSESTLECQTLDASAYFEDSVVNYQVGNYAVSSTNEITTGNFTMQLLDDIKPFIQNLCSGCANLTGMTNASKPVESIWAFAGGDRIEIQNRGSRPIAWTIYSRDGQSIRNGIAQPGIIHVGGLSTGFYLVRAGDACFKVLLVRD